MKTQINSLVKGDHRESIVGTTSAERNAIALKVREENPETMTILLRGREIKLQANWSVSRKSVSYMSEIPLDLYIEFFGNFGLPKENPKAFILIQTDCTVNFQTNSKKQFFNYIKEQEVTIL